MQRIHQEMDNMDNTTKLGGLSAIFGLVGYIGHSSCGFGAAAIPYVLSIAAGALALDRKTNFSQFLFSPPPKPQRPQTTQVEQVRHASTP